MLKLLSNKHVVIAMLVTPVLAVVAWISVGEFAGEQPHRAVAGQHYPLVEQSNCRYASNSCDLRNEDFRLVLSLKIESVPKMLLTASHPLNGVLMSIGPAETDSPERMQPSGSGGTRWEFPLTQKPMATDRIRLVASAGQSTYFAEASTAFLSSEIVSE